MEDTLSKTVKDIAILLEDNKAVDVEVINVKGLCSWGDYIILATGTSATHIRGLKNEAKKMILEDGGDIKNPRRRDDTDSWVLYDCGDYIVNLMDKETREFYNIEQRWSAGEVIYQSSSSS